MPIPNQADQIAGRDLGVGIPGWTGSNQLLAPNYTPNLLRSGTAIVFIDSAGARHNTLMGDVDVTRNPVEISVNQLVNGRVTTLCNVPYNDSAGSPGYTWRFPSDG